jgi:hypothetical protein
MLYTFYKHRLKVLTQNATPKEREVKVYKCYSVVGSSLLKRLYNLREGIELFFKLTYSFLTALKAFDKLIKGYA